MANAKLERTATVTLVLNECEARAVKVALSDYITRHWGTSGSMHDDMLDVNNVLAGVLL